MPVLTEPAGADETTEAGRQEEGASLAEAARVAKKEELEHTEWLSSTEAVHQRETSQSAFVGLSAKDAQGLLLETFPEQLRELNSDPARVLSELEIEEPLGTYGARISSGGETAVVESSVPVQSDLGGNGSEPVDLALQRSGSGYVPQNPLTEVELPGSAADPIALHDGVEVELPTSGDHAVEPLGDKNLFIAEAETDTDTLIAPTAAGVEVFEQLRSPESPEEFRFPFNLPQGAKIQEGAHGVEVLSATGELLEEVPAPTAVDAQGTSVPVTMNVEGEALVIDVAHRSADIAYPLLLDPRYNEGYESPPLNSAWTSYSNGPYGLGQSPSSLLAYSQGNSVSYAANTRGQWEYTAPGETTYIENASFAPIYFYVNNCPTSEPYGWVGIANSGGYNSYGIYSGGNISSPGGFQAGNGGVGTRKAVVGIGTVNASTLKCAHEMWVGGVTVQENDPEKPTINSVSGVPSGWFDPAKAGNVTISATDPGFGVDSVRIANAGGGGSEDSVGCTGMWNSRCPRNVNWTVSPPYKGGERQLYVSAEDPTGKVGEWSTTTKVDATKPEIDLGGQLAYATEEEGTEGEENEAKENKLSLPVYNLHIDAIDGSNKETQTKQSGVKKIELFLDGVLQKKWEAPACPENSCSLEENYPLHLTGLEEGEHKLEVVATDRVGLSRPRTIEFEYIPATGITDEYVMQHFPLPDGEEGEEGSHGPELAVNVMNGNLVYHERDAKVSTPSTNVEVERFYNSQLPEADSSEWGKGWTLSQTPRFTPEEGSGKEGGQPIASALGSSGAVTRAVKLPSVDGEERFDPHLHATVTKLAGGGYEVADESSEGGETITYDSSGKPSETRTGTYSKVNYGYEGGKLSEIAVQDPAATDTPPEEALEEEGASGQPVYRSSLGASGTEDGEVLSPGGMALDTSGHLWVADRGNDRVQEFGSAGEYLGKIGSFGSGTGRLRSPAAVAIDSGGDVWVADAGNDRLEEFNQEGKYLSQLGAKGTGSGQFSDPGPQGLAIDSEGGILVADTGGGRIERFSKEGKFIESFGASELSEPTGIAVGPGNRIWVTDGVTDEVLEFSSAGKLIRQFGSEGEEEGQFQHPSSIAVDTEGRVWVCDTGTGRVQELTEAGEFLHEFGSEGSIEGRLKGPKGIVADTKGDVWVAGVGSEASESGPPAEEEPPAKEEPPAEEPAEEELGEGPVASYSFNEGSGETAHDSSGHHHDATLHGASWTGEGKYGGAIHFNAADHDHLTIPASPQLNFSKAFTLEAWVKPEEERKWAPIFAKTEASEEAGFSYLLYARNGEGKPQGQLSSESDWAGPKGTEALPQDTWSHLALVFDGEEAHLYVNGKAVASEHLSGTLKTTETALRIGGNDQWHEYFDGTIDEVRIYNRALSEAEVGKDSETAVTNAPEGPVASYSFNEGSGETAHDSSGHHHDATLHGASWTGEGKYGGAIHFNAADHDHLTIPASPQLNFSKAFTLEAWVKPEEERKWAPIFAKTEASEEAGFSYLLYARNGEGKPEGQVLEGKENWSSPKGAEALPQNAWSHVALVSDGEDMRLFVNGKVVDTENAATPPSTEGALQIGGDSWGEYFDGAIDEVRLYDRALDGEEIREDGETPLEASPTVPAYQIQKWSVSSSPPPTEPADDPSLSVGYESGLVSSVESDQAPTQSYEHEGGLLTAHVGPEGKAEYAYDEAERLTEVRLPNGTTAKIEYEAALGRVTAVTVDPVGEAPAKTTHFKYTDEPRETVVTPEAEQATHYSIGADGSVLKWWNEKSPPEIEELTGSLYSERGEVHPEPISSGDQVLEVEAYDPEGVASIEIVANGSDLVAEKTCQEPEDECPKLSKEFITETENWPPGILQLEVIVTDRENQVASERFWDNIPYTPPPGSEAPEPPRFEEILRFREEFGLDLDLKGNERARNERIFDLIDAWHNPNTYLGEVARSSMERWGVPMRPQDVAEMEYREWYIANDIPLIEEWAEAQAPGTYAGYYVDHREGGIIHVGFTQNQAERLSELKQQVSLTASDRLAVYPAVPSTPHASLQATVEAVEGDWDTNSVLEALVTEVGIDEESNTVQVGATDVAQVESILRADLGASAPVSVIYETSGEPFAGRNRTSGRILAGDRIINANRSEGCTAGFGAWEARTKKSTDELTVAMFLLIAGHCGSIGDGLWRAPSQNSVNKSEWKKIGDVTRTGAPMGGQHYETDAAAVRLEDSGLVPRAIFRNGQNARPVGQAGTAKHGEVLCFSGQKTNEVQCGEMIGVRRRSWPSPGRHIFIITRFAGLPGDSGAPVWSPRTGKSIGLVSGGPNRPGLHKDWVTPLVTPRGFSSEKVPGALGAPGMYSLNIMEGD